MCLLEIKEFDSLNKVINNVQFKILEHGHVQTGKEWNFPRVCSPFNRLYLVISGSGAIKEENHSMTLQKGNMYLIPLYHTCDYSCEDTLEKFYIHFRLELIPGHDLFANYGHFSSKPVGPGLAEDLVSKAQRGQISDLIYCKSVLLDCISRFLEPCADKLNEHMKVSDDYIPVYDYILNHCYADLRVKDIEGHFGISPGSLSKSFKKDTGVTLKRFIDGKVVQKAQEKLLVTDLPVKDIAYDLKFSDEFHFSCFFKKHVGLAPNKYRQRNNLYK
jgi:AraC-type DNA-binding domain-containing proteins